MQKALNTLGYKSYHYTTNVLSHHPGYWRYGFEAKINGSPVYGLKEFDALLGEHSVGALAVYIHVLLFPLFSRSIYAAMLSQNMHSYKPWLFPLGTDRLPMHPEYSAREGMV